MTHFLGVIYLTPYKSRRQAVILAIAYFISMGGFIPTTTLAAGFGDALGRSVIWFGGITPVPSMTSTFDLSSAALIAYTNDSSFPLTNRPKPNPPVVEIEPGSQSASIFALTKQAAICQLNMPPSPSEEYEDTRTIRRGDFFKDSGIYDAHSSGFILRCATSFSIARFSDLNSSASFSKALARSLDAAASFPAAAARSIAARSASVCLELSSSSSLAYAASRTELSDSYSHSAETPTMTNIGNKRVFLDSLAIEHRSGRNSIGYMSQYNNHNFLISFQYSPTRPKATTREAAAIADLSQVIKSSSEDRSMPDSQYNRGVEALIQSSIWKDKIITIVLIASVLSVITILIYDNRQGK
jgi:hypothetical protein